MKFIFGKIPENNEFDPHVQGWLAIKEPPVWAIQLLSLPIAVVAMLVLCWLWSGIISLEQFDIPVNLWLIVWIVAAIIVHELVHAVFHPGYGIGPKTLMGFWPVMGIFYAHYDGPISKWRFITILLAPFAILSIVPLLFCAMFQCQSNILFAISEFNALLSCCDLLGSIFIFCQIPSNAITQNKGWNTYYKTNE